MGYRIVDPEAVDPAPDRPSECRKLSEPGGLETMAINRFHAAPGEELPLAYHYHETQQEAFYVLEGDLAVETPEETYEVPEERLFVVDPGHPQRAYNPAGADGPVTVLAIGAPAADSDARVYDRDPEPEPKYEDA
ncbi:cupin domain-containing protein [Natronosalvus halobius]|uniref:cupin domain-containing protein n=1 Tax=Natronosalvus halobius TaxID=2953746 RepID=UPI00209C7454|nr:cupin domain-containing protein [Natronosalvus halobius]USZ71583.1 cupin domain-containing protein [Natronosalvus halobius]